MKNLSANKLANPPPKSTPRVSKTAPQLVQTSATLPQERVKARRIQSHVNESLSSNHVERFILQCGFTIVKPVDYGYDLVINFFDENGYYENGSVFLQLKSVVKPYLTKRDRCVAYNLERRHLDTWASNPYPVIFVLYDVGRECAYWRDVRSILRELDSRQLPDAQVRVRVRVPLANVVGQDAVLLWKRMKDKIHALMQTVAAAAELDEEIEHDNKTNR